MKKALIIADMLFASATVFRIYSNERGNQPVGKHTSNVFGKNIYFKLLKTVQSGIKNAD
ncbi:MAG: hypothetical protein K5780_06000 [Alphaproteobacteria bacterium]|nr:hypothetical protein [Alphaproteobacteria bacterium]